MARLPWKCRNVICDSKVFMDAVCMAGGAGFVGCWVGSTFWSWELPLHALRLAFRILSSILGENASAATFWWPFSGNTAAFHFKPVAIQLCQHNLLLFV